MSVNSEGWLDNATKELAEVGIVGLTCQQDMDALIKAVSEFISNPVTVDYHNFFPVVDAFRETDGGDPCLVVNLREHI